MVGAPDGETRPARWSTHTVERANCHLAGPRAAAQWSAGIPARLLVTAKPSGGQAPRSPKARHAPLGAPAPSLSAYAPARFPYRGCRVGRPH